MNYYNLPVTDIPKIFLPHQSDGPFSTCVNCDRNLLDENTDYVIEKAVRQYREYGTQDVIFEYAMCMSCAELMRQELSRESLQRVQDYMQKSNLAASRQTLIDRNNWNIQDWISHCAVSGESVEQQDEYQLFAHCRGGQLVFSAMPYMISGTVAEAMAELLSAKTRDELNRFVDDNFGLPPELKQPITDRPIVLL
jgi:hypothetical protein